MSAIGSAVRIARAWPVWHAQRWIRRDPSLWIFGAWDGLRYSDNSRALYEYVLEHCPQIRAVWVTRSPAVYERLQREQRPVVLCDTPEGRRTMLHASTFFATEGVGDVDPACLNGCRIVMLWHGMPLKLIGEDAMRFKRPNHLWKRFKTAVRRLIVPYEFLRWPTLSTSPFFTPFLQSAFRLSAEEVWEVGLPRNDRFSDAATEALVAELDRQFDHPVKLLYMPTHRDACTRTGRAFNPFEQAGFDQALLEEVLASRNMVLLYKGHFVDRANGMSQGPGSRIRTVTDADYDDLYRFVKDMDVLVTDYSSIYFDFLLCRKPILLFPFDEADYVARSRPFYFDYRLMEARRVYTWAELAEALRRGDYAAPSEAEVRRFNLYVDNGSCQRLVERLLHPSARKP